MPGNTNSADIARSIQYIQNRTDISPEQKQQLVNDMLRGTAGAVKTEGFIDESRYGYGNFTPGAQQAATRYTDLASKASARFAPTLRRTEADWTAGGPGGAQFQNPVYQQQMAGREQQNQFIDRLQADMDGRAPSAAQMQLQQGVDANIAAANALRASAGPQNYSGAQRQAMIGAANANQQAAGQSAILRAQEYAGAREAMAGALNNRRVQDLQATGMSYQNALAQAQLEAGQNQTQANLQMQQNALNQQGELAYEGMGQDVYQTDLSSRMHYNDLMAQKYANDKGLAQQASQYQQGRSDKREAAMIGAVGTALPYIMSDMTQKTDIEPASGADISDFLGKLHESTYRYKNEKHGKGEHFGIMAQDMEKSRVGRTIVVQTPEGKMLDVKKALGALLASGAYQEKRIRELEARD